MAIFIVQGAVDELKSLVVKRLCSNSRLCLKKIEGSLVL